MSGLHQALSRRNEFHADAEAARLTGDPMALSQALARIQFATGGSMDLKTAFEVHGRSRPGLVANTPIGGSADRQAATNGRSSGGLTAVRRPFCKHERAARLQD